MGNKITNAAETTITACTRAMVSAVTKTESDNKMFCSTNQTMDIVIGEGAVVDNLDVKQVSGLACNLTSTLTGDFNTNVKTAVSNELESLVKQTGTAVSDFLSTSVNTVQGKVSVKQAIEVELATALENITTNKCQANVNVQQTLRLWILGKVATAKLEQNAQAEAMSACLTDVIVNNLASNEAINRAATRSEQEGSGQTKGLSDLLSALTSFWGLLIIGGIIGLIVLLFVFKYLSSPVGKTAQAGSSAVEMAVLSQLGGTGKQGKG
jgi:hypothetical protein